MKTYYNTTFQFSDLTQEMYDKLTDFIEENFVGYKETDFEEFVVDNRTKEEKYQDWLDEQADAMYEERLINNE